MNNSTEMLAFLDLLDLDEELVDARLKTILDRNSHSNTHLSNALLLLQYKNLINLQENTCCENTKEFDFVVKLIKNIHTDIAENVCKITNSVLSLNARTLVSNSQHLLQQLLSNIDLSSDKPKSTDDDADQSRSLLYFKVCDSVLDAIIQHGLQIDLLLMEVPLEKSIFHADEKVKIHFITSTVPRMFKGVVGFNILDTVWSYIKELKEIEVALKVLSCLSDYYLPAVDAKGNIQFESKIVYDHQFWRITLFGLMSTEFTYRKISVYLTKRALEYISSKQINIQIKSVNNIIIFSWDYRKTDVLKNHWDNFFILLDSLEEKQSNIVLPSLQLFDTINEIHNSWVNCAFNLGLKHDNSQVRLKSVEYRLKRKVNSVTEAIVIIQALDDINFYETTRDINILKGKLMEMLKDDKSLIHVLEAIPQANLSPVPLFHLTDVLAELDFHILFATNKNASKIIMEIMKSSCNIIALRKAINNNISHFVSRCKGLDWKVIAKVFSLLHLETEEIDYTKSPLYMLIDNKFTPNEGDTRELMKYVTSTVAYIDFGLLYLDRHPEDLNLYIEIINDKILHVRNIVNRQYSNKLDCLNDVLILLKIFSRSNSGNSTAKECVKNMIMKESKIIAQYLLCLLTSDTVVTVDESKSLFNCFKCPVDFIVEDSKETYNQLYKSSVILLNDTKIELEKAALCMFIINNLSANKTFVRNFKHEMLDIKGFIDIARIFEKREVHNAQSIGRLKNTFYEKHSETVNIILEEEDLKLNKYLKNLVDYLDDIIECGGYGCLYWVLKIINKILKLLTDAKDVKFDINQFINRMWREIEELKTNNHNYSPCMEEFARLVTQEALLEKPDFNNIVILYCKKIIEYGPVKNNPLYYLVRELKEKEIKHNHLLCILGELLLYCPVSRKDQRITDNLAVEILRNTKYGVINNDIDLHFNFEIQYATVSMLSQIKDSENLNTILNFITNKIDDIFKHKVRYHGNSQIHRTIQTGLQHLLFILLINSSVESKRKLNWCLYILGKMPHQQSVKICLEWYITLCFYIEGQPLNHQLIDLLKSKNVPISSQFIIIYWLLKHKIADSTFSNDEYEFVLDTFFSHTMGQMFNIRLHAQYLSTKVYELNTNNKGKYDYTIEVINKTLNENAKDKHFMKLKEDYFVNEFDVVSNLSPYFLYNSLPKLCDSNNGEIYDLELVTYDIKEIYKNISNNDNNAFKKEWTRCRIKDKELVQIELNKQSHSKAVEELEKLGTLQKKYVPWKNMSDVNVYETTKKRESPSDLIVIASLIDKLPNLGGMARTSEVFGVKTYVIDNLKHLQDKQFQGLSVSAEKWIDIEEIRPGQSLKDYLNRKKAEGYAVVAAEQTSTGSKLQTFKFPRKTLLLLGHEKEGVPCDLLPMMDHCVEIPQQGFVRSLNVHVTAAIFVWEYARQNLL